MYRSLRFLPLLLAFTAGAVHATPAAESFFKDPQISHVRLSPKGGYVAVVTKLPDGASALTARDTSDPSKFTLVLKTSPLESINAVHWINEKRIGFTMKNLRADFNGTFDEMAADRDGSDLAHLISGSWDHTAEVTGSAVRARTLTTDYRYYSTVSDGSDDILVRKSFWNNVDVLPSHTRLYRLNTRTRELRGSFEGTQPEGAYYWTVDRYDVPRVVTSQLKGRCTTSYRRSDTSVWSELDSGVCFKDSRFSPEFFDGDDTLFVRANHNGYAALFRYDLKNMKMDKEPLISVPGFDFSGTAEFDLSTRRLVGIHLQTDAGSTYWFNPVLKAEQAKIDALMPATTNTVECAADCLGAKVLLVTASSDRHPRLYMLYHRASGELTGVGAAYPDIDAAQMGMRDFHRYQARDGRQIPAYVTLPAGPATGPRPAVVLVHGGPNARGAYWDWDDEAQFLASRGYVVIQPEFRGSTGFGTNHFEAGWKQWGGAMQDDLADAALWAVQQGWADPKRIGIMGASYGGYATLMGLIKHPAIFRAGVEWAGVTDIGLMFTATESDASRDTLDYSLRTLIGDPDKDADTFRRNSPLLRAAELKQPLLIAHGLTDRRVPVVHASTFRDAVKKNNPNVEYITYHNEAHGWRREETRIDFWTKVDAFLDKNLKQAK